MQVQWLLRVFRIRHRIASNLVVAPPAGGYHGCRISEAPLSESTSTDARIHVQNGSPSGSWEQTYKGSGRLQGIKAIITGGDSGIGRAVAIAYAREGADVLIAYLSEDEDAKEVKDLIEKEGRKAVLVPGDLQHADHCRAVVQKAVDELDGIDILVNNPAHQATFKDIGDISDEEWETTFKPNIHAMFYLVKAAVPHMKPGSAIVNTASVNADMPNPILLAYATTKGAIQNFTGGLAQMLADKGHTGERGGSGTDLDTADPIDNA
jgi:NADP-dependent 3-hydroxy acid dehydrogenase YdfG